MYYLEIMYLFLIFEINLVDGTRFKNFILPDYKLFKADLVKLLFLIEIIRKLKSKYTKIIIHVILFYLFSALYLFLNIISVIN